MLSGYFFSFLSSIGEAEVVCMVTDGACVGEASCGAACTTAGACVCPEALGAANPTSGGSWLESALSILTGVPLMAAGTCFGFAASLGTAGWAARPPRGLAVPTLVGAPCMATGTCSGPVLTTISTAVPSSTVVPAWGSCSITSPAGTVSSEASFRSPSSRPASSSVSSVSEA
jgi:hypothetical protein